MCSRLLKTVGHGRYISTGLSDVCVYQNVWNKFIFKTQILFEMVLEEALAEHAASPWTFIIIKLINITLTTSKMNSLNAPTTQISTIDKMTTVKCKSVDLEGYVIIVVQTKDNKVKLYGKFFSLNQRLTKRGWIESMRNGR